MTAFTVETDDLQFSLGPSKVLPLRSFQLSTHQAYTVKLTNLALTLVGRASNLGQSSSRAGSSLPFVRIRIDLNPLASEGIDTFRSRLYCTVRRFGEHHLRPLGFSQNLRPIPLELAFSY